MRKYILLFCTFISIHTFAQITIGFKEFCCDNTTEWGNDEIYFLISAKFSNGNELNKIVPDGYGNIYMNDDKGDHICIGSKELVSFLLEDEDSVIFVVTIMEQDGNNAKPYLKNQAFLSNLLLPQIEFSKSDAAISSKLISLFPPKKKDVDDWIGTLEISINKNKGIINSEWHIVNKRNKDNLVLNLDENNSYFINFDHQRPRYKGWFYVK